MHYRPCQQATSRKIEARGASRASSGAVSVAALSVTSLKQGRKTTALATGSFGKAYNAAAKHNREVQQPAAQSA